MNKLLLDAVHDNRTLRAGDTVALVDDYLLRLVGGADEFDRLCRTYEDLMWCYLDTGIPTEGSQANLEGFAEWSLRFDALHAVEMLSLEGVTAHDVWFRASEHTTRMILRIAQQKVIA
ncbi:hypothetical protein [Gordonia tangerina]|uniref:Uncharacterized protein n=1 Tax=Gordonia tangerina TaxID=2911060 RepID=A0ABS9DGV4_9ACTN|nr:hypothetical protein [Gordonia tangerina]MCF3938391.1 hypothetical protein [Gordonia tangerina]